MDYTMNKKGNGMTGPLMVGVTAVMMLFIVGFMLSIGATLVEDLRGGASAQNESSSLYNITGDSLSGFDKVSGFQGTIGLIIAAIIIISILMALVGVVVFKKLG